MLTAAFLDQVIDRGIEGARQDYAGTTEQDRQMREGAVAGFEACRGQTPAALTVLLAEAAAERDRKHRERAADYWFWTCRYLEIEWCCNCVSAALLNEDQPVIIPPTIRAMTQAAEILGIGGHDAH